MDSATVKAKMITYLLNLLNLILKESVLFDLMCELCVKRKKSPNVLVL